MLTTKQAALGGIESVRSNSSDDAQYERRTDKNDPPYFVLKARNGEVIGRSEMYTTNSGMENGIGSQKRTDPGLLLKKGINRYIEFDMSIIHRDESGRVSFGVLDYLIQALIGLSMVSFAVETLPNLSASSRRTLESFEMTTIGIFSVEYAARVALTRPSNSYALSFLGIVDLIAIAPFYFSTGVDLRSVRAFRLLRLFRLLKLSRYNAALQRFHIAFKLVREELVLFGAAALIVLYLSSVGIYYFEHQVQPEAFASVFHALWWSVATLTTVGYGDVYPITTAGRVFTFFVLTIGLGIVAVPTGLLASALAQARGTTSETTSHSAKPKQKEFDRN